MTNTQATTYQGFLKKGLTVIDILPKLYKNSDGVQQREIIGSIFPEKLKSDKKIVEPLKSTKRFFNIQ